MRKLLSVRHHPPSPCCILGTCTATLRSWQHCTQVNRVQPLLAAGVAGFFVKPASHPLIPPESSPQRHISSLWTHRDPHRVDVCRNYFARMGKCVHRNGSFLMYDVQNWTRRTPTITLTRNLACWPRRLDLLAILICAAALIDGPLNPNTEAHWLFTMSVFP